MQNFFLSPNTLKLIFFDNRELLNTLQRIKVAGLFLLDLIDDSESTSPNNLHQGEIVNGDFIIIILKRNEHFCVIGVLLH
jgi:hypothetical protein